MLVITDGRDDYLARCVASIHRQVWGDITEWWMFDDTGNAPYRTTLASRYPQWMHIDGGPRLGCAGATRAAWKVLARESQAEYVLHVEQDFTIEQDIDVDELGLFLDEHPYLAQVVLRRNAVNPAEMAAGGVVEQHPDWYVDMSEYPQFPRYAGRRWQWLEHAAFWSSNPCLYRRSLTSMGWPEAQPGRYSEDTFTQRLRTEGTPEMAGPEVRFAFWGARNSGMWVRHIGKHRHVEGTGY